MTSGTSSPRSRLFLAAYPRAEQRKFLVGLQKRLKTRNPAWERSLRWVAPEKWHLTLRFFGEVAPELVAPLLAAIRTYFERANPLPFSLGGVSGFPRPLAARVLFVGVQEGREELRNLVEPLETVLAPLGFSPDSRPFSPHLTLARTRRGKVLIPRDEESSPTCLLSSVHLLQSPGPSNQPGYRSLLEVRFPGNGLGNERGR